MGTRELRHNKRDGAECCRTAHSTLWSDLASFNVLHLWETKSGPTTWVKCVTDLDICSLLLLALDVRKLWCLNKIQVPTDQAMRWLEGICVSCKSERVLLTYSFLVQLLMGFLDSWNFIRNSGCPLGILRSPGHSLSGKVPRSLRCSPAICQVPRSSYQIQISCWVPRSNLWSSSPPVIWLDCCHDTCHHPGAQVPRSCH